MNANGASAILRAALVEEVTWTSIPLSRAVLCPDPSCATVWDVRHRRCPKCNSEQCYPLAKKFAEQRAA